MKIDFCDLHLFYAVDTTSGGGGGGGGGGKWLLFLGPRPPDIQIYMLGLGGLYIWESLREKGPSVNYKKV